MKSHLTVLRCIIFEILSELWSLRGGFSRAACEIVLNDWIRAIDIFREQQQAVRHRQFNGAARKRIEKYENSTEPAKREAKQKVMESFELTFVQLIRFRM